MEATTIRSIEISDVPAVASLLVELARKFITMEFSQDAEATFLRKNDAEAISGFLRSGYTYWVAEAQGQIVGFIGMRKNSHLYHLFVAEKAQNRGLARALWNTAKEACCAAGNPGRFTVNSSNNAVAVYESFGFVRTEPTRSLNGILYNPMALVVDS
jgi:ribosomal protein S18 acetylase RimI-like enzyme